MKDLKPQETQVLVVGTKGHINELVGIIGYFQATTNTVKVYKVEETNSQIRVLELKCSIGINDSITEHLKQIFHTKEAAEYHLKSNSLNIKLHELNFQTYVSFFGLKDVEVYFAITDTLTPKFLFATLTELISYFSFQDIGFFIRDFLTQINTATYPLTQLSAKIENLIADGLSLEDASRLWNHLLIITHAYQNIDEFCYVVDQWLVHDKAERAWKSVKDHL